jgi:hypothetical protein
VVIDEGCKRYAAIMAMIAVSLTISCRHKEKGMASMVNMADPSTASQLVSGFYAVENGAWRWTSKKFSIVLKTPPGSAASGAMLRFRLFVSDDQINRLGPITLSADVDGHQLDPQTYSKPGDYAYSRPIPADALKAASVKVNFSLDKAREPDNVDVRQLGVVASLIGLQPR